MRAPFRDDGREQDWEGIGICALPNGTGYIIPVDQRPDESIFHMYTREAEPGRLHDHSTGPLRFSGRSDRADGLDVTSAQPSFP
jgi:myo-inositol-hexaphosphate 3-phosphohydrolase